MNDSDSVRRARQIALAQEAPFELADTRVSPAALEVEHAGRVQALEPRVMKVLVALRRADGQPVSRDDLTMLCWGGRVVTDGALNRCVAQLRRALSTDERIQLETIATVGYRLQTKPAVQRTPDVRGADEPPQLSDAAAKPELVEGVITTCATAACDLAAVPAPRQPLWRRRRTWYLGGVTIALAAIAVGFAVLQRPVKWMAVAYRPLTTAPDFETYPALSPSGQQIVYAVAPNGYGARDLYLRNVDQGMPVQITSDENDDYGAAWSPAGDRVAFVRSFNQGPCTVLVVPVPRGPERVVARCQVATQTRPSWLDSRTLVFSDQPAAEGVSRIRAVDVETGAVRDLTSPPVSTLGDAEPQASPDGRYIAFRRMLTIGADDLFMLDVRSGEECALTTDGWKAGGYVWSADSRHVFFSSNKGGEFGLWSVDRGRRRPPRRVTLGLGTVTFARMSADLQNRLAVELTHGRTLLSKVSPSGEIQLVTSGAGSDFEPAAAADGTLAYISARNGAYEIWTTSPFGQSMRLTSIVGSYVTRPTWSPDGQTIAFVAVHGRNAELYTVARDGSQLHRLTSDGVHKRDPVYSASGKQLFYVERREGTWRLMELSLTATPLRAHAVPRGQGWKTLHAGPNRTIFGQRDGESTLRVLNASAHYAAGGSAASGVPMDADPHALADGGPKISDIDVWVVGAQGIYVRRGRRVHEPSSIWLYPWGETGRKLADTPLAAGPIGLDPQGQVIFSQTLDYQIDLGLVEIAPGS